MQARTSRSSLYAMLLLCALSFNISPSAAQKWGIGLSATSLSRSQVMPFIARGPGLQVQRYLGDRLCLEVAPEVLYHTLRSDGLYFGSQIMPGGQAGPPSNASYHYTTLWVPATVGYKILGNKVAWWMHGGLVAARDLLIQVETNIWNNGAYEVDHSRYFMPKNGGVLGADINTRLDVQLYHRLHLQALPGMRYSLLYFNGYHIGNQFAGGSRLYTYASLRLIYRLGE